MATSLPGTPLDSMKAESVFTDLLRMYRTEDPPLGVPTHCGFRWRQRQIFWGELFDEQWIAEDTAVYFIEETTRMQRFPQNITLAVMADVRTYWKRREPWEFADTYILNKAMEWCIVITHDDECRFAEYNDVGDEVGQIE